VELPGIEPDALPGNMCSEMQVHSVSFRFVPARHLRFVLGSWRRQERSPTAGNWYWSCIVWRLGSDARRARSLRATRDRTIRRGVSVWRQDVYRWASRIWRRISQPFRRPGLVRW